MDVPVDIARKFWKGKLSVLERIRGTHLCCDVDFDGDVVVLTPIGGVDRTGPGVKCWRYLEVSEDRQKVEQIRMKLIHV